jgi:hypothetical protein
MAAVIEMIFVIRFMRRLVSVTAGYSLQASPAANGTFVAERATS